MSNEIKSQLDQPEPVKNDNEALWPMVIEDIRYSIGYSGDVIINMVADAEERHEVGMKRYGTALQAFNGRDPRIDAYQEALDLLVYLKQAILECSDDDWSQKEVLEHLYESTMDTAADLRAMIG